MTAKGNGQFGIWIDAGARTTASAPTVTALATPRNAASSAARSRCRTATDPGNNNIVAGNYIGVAPTV